MMSSSLSLSLPLSLSVLTAVRRYQNVFSVFDFVGVKDDAGRSDNWSYKTCKAPVKSSPPTNQHEHQLFTGRTPVLSPNQQRHSTGMKTGVSSVKKLIGLRNAELIAVAVSDGNRKDYAAPNIP